MPTAPVNDKGTELFYTDSGAVPNSSDYTTLIVYHGSAFNGNTFKRLLPFAAPSNIRLVLLNRRDYAGSTKYTDEALKDLNAGDVKFLQNLGLEVAHLLNWFAETQKIPKITDDGKKGGIVVMGWSLGNSTPLAMLAYPDVIGKAAYTKLEPYYRKLILYDPPHLAFGYDQPPEGYNPFTDPELPTPEAIFNNFGLWVSEYYNHPDLASRSVTGMDFAKHGENPTINNMKPEELAETFDAQAASRTEFPMFFPMQPTLKAQTQLALFDEKLVSEFLPRLDIVHIWCTRTEWYSVYGFMETERQYKQHTEKGRKVRPIRFKEIEGANHFVHWDDPDAFWTAVVDAVNV